MDESLGGLSLADPRQEEADAELASREKEMILTTGDHESKVIVHVESIKGDASAQERELEPSSKRRKQESDQIPMHFTLCDDSSDQVAKSVDDSAKLETCRGPTHS